ncbi:interleukin-21 receptor isoform X1 [Ictalurus furcatus]|uniref:interleukin-21 receptor isoform X1 n=1 Tax=Ictalurus furcatus TaxID=66913 RepID=UPI002350DA2B|nr:interleukin-21 receptor isoform X1 [Ictalurus furcatus]XP_053475942.1 interleukin-21 receptor isoform X1 [Ictalurus furcatus]XP_053476005.1 interleukin-21 receptor isoform X1 [Ictalurus furcatus]
MRCSLFFQLFVCFSHLRGTLMWLNMTDGHNCRLECLNDYLYTIRCELNMTSEPRPHDALYWLEFHDELETFECALTSQTYSWLCVLNLYTRVEHTFMDTDFFQISLNYSFHGNNGSTVLKKVYMPVKNIQPVPPSKLMLLWKPDEAVFHWLSGYIENVMLVPFLQYQLSIHRTNKVLDVHSFQTNVSVPMSTFEPDTNYTAHLRSAPYGTSYKGVWSHWGPAIYWRTGRTKKVKLDTAATGPEADTLDMSFARVWLALFLLPLILFCYFSYTRWKRYVLNPGPAPHIGDFKCLGMLPENVGELLQKEESLQIDHLTEEPNPTQYKNMSNVNDSSGHTPITGSPRSPSTLQCSVDSKVSMSSWMQVLMSAENGSVTYSDDYCTLSHALSEHAVNTHKH